MLKACQQPCPQSLAEAVQLLAAFPTRQWELFFPLLSQGQMQRPNWLGLSLLQHMLCHRG